jgi:hypothetical protein
MVRNRMRRQASAGRNGFMVSEFPYGYLESVNGIGDKGCDHGIPRAREFSCTLTGSAVLTIFSFFA